MPHKLSSQYNSSWEFDLYKKIDGNFFPLHLCHLAFIAIEQDVMCATTLNLATFVSDGNLKYQNGCLILKKQIQCH
jgi:hypothetical protein